ncbi:hypothetical protein WJX77_004135 [Trebouxia sp. C0004]
MAQRPYTVQQGDTVVHIAQAFGTVSSNLVTQEGQLPDPFKLFPAQQLVIRLDRPANQTTHQVIAGETLSLIAQQHRIPASRPKAANPGVDPWTPQPGLTLRLSYNGSGKTPTAGSGGTTTADPGCRSPIHAGP